MSKKLLFVGVDVDDKAYHFSIVNSLGHEIVSGKRVARDAGALKRAIQKHTKKTKFLVGYEATYLGYTLYRRLNSLKVDCKVIAPTSIAKAAKNRVKNDRIDSLKLAQGLRTNELSYVAVPTLEQESDRQLLRSRSFLVKQRSDLKRHIVTTCRIADLDYKHETGAKEFWTKKHRDWLDRKLKTLPPSIHVALATLLSQLEAYEKQIETLETEIDHLASQSRYEKKVSYLSAFKGLSTISSMTIITEIHDINRFKHPRSLVSFSGMEIGEYSSGGNQSLYGITKMGNKRLRTALVEACQQFSTSKRPTKRQLRSRPKAPKEAIDIADRCQARLYKKGHRLLAREKHRNKVKVACAREMIGFIWEALRAAA